MTLWYEVLEREHRHKVDDKPPLEDVVLSDTLQVCHNLKRLRMLETLDKVKEEINPKHSLNEVFKYVKVLVIRSCESNVEHGGDTGVTNQKQDEHVEDSLPFTGRRYDDFVFTLLLVSFVVDVFAVLVDTVDPLFSRGDGCRLEDFAGGPRSIQRLSPLPLIVLEVNLLDLLLLFLVETIQRSWVLS